MSQELLKDCQSRLNKVRRESRQEKKVPIAMNRDPFSLFISFFFVLAGENAQKRAMNYKRTRIKDPVLTSLFSGKQARFRQILCVYWTARLPVQALNVRLYKAVLKEAGDVESLIPNYPDLRH